MRRRSGRQGLLLGAVCLGVVVAAASAVGAPGARRGGVLRISGPGTGPTYVDPALAYTPASWMVENATCALLYGYPDKPGAAGTRVVPEVARAFPAVSRDGRTYTIDLRTTYRFHTGQRVTAAHYVHAINRLANPRTASDARPYLDVIVGARAVMAGEAATVSGVRALAPDRLQIRTTKHLPDLAARLTMPFFCPLPTSTPTDPSGITNPAGSGPYYLATYRPNQLWVLRRNPYYDGPRAANVDRIELEWGVSSAACQAAAAAGETDYCLLGVPPAAWRQAAAEEGINKPGGRVFFDAVLGGAFLAFNHDRSAFKGPGQIPLKQAINWAIDRPAMVRTLGFLNARRTDQLLPPAMGRPAKIYPLEGVTAASLRRARALLARTRFTPERIVVYASPAEAEAAEVFAFNMKRLGIDVETRYFDGSEYLDRISTRGEPFDMAFSGWITDYADPAGFLSILVDGRTLRPTQNTNVAYYDNRAVNRTLERISRLSGDARIAAFAALDVQLMRDDPPYATYAALATRIFVSANVGCVVIHPVIARLNLVAVCKT
jgi:ABC-type transport system substrate-binding protein